MPVMGVIGGSFFGTWWTHCKAGQDSCPAGVFVSKGYTLCPSIRRYGADRTAGVDGIFRFKTDGTNARGLSVLRVTPQGGQVVSPPPRAFGGSAT